MQPVASKSVNLGVDVISPRDFEGRVDFRKVHFNYPTRPDMHVLSGLDLTLRAGEVTALVRAGAPPAFFCCRCCWLSPSLLVWCSCLLVEMVLFCCLRGFETGVWLNPTAVAPVCCGTTWRCPGVRSIENNVDLHWWRRIPSPPAAAATAQNLPYFGSLCLVFYTVFVPMQQQQPRSGTAGGGRARSPHC